MKDLFQASAGSIRFAHILIRVLVVFGLFFVPVTGQWLLNSLWAYYVYFCIGLGITLHRYYSHRSFEFSNVVVKWLFVFIGVLTLRGSPIAWAYIHRKHHKNVDTELDPHTPVGHKLRLFSLMDKDHSTDKFNIFEIRKMMNKENIFINQWYWLAVLAFIIPLGLYSLTALYYLWILPVAVVQLSITLHNYLAHTGMLGSYRNHETGNVGQSNNLPLLWLLYLGEAWHNNHHSRGQNYNCQTKWWELDPQAWLIKLVKQ
jgi:stearoyl-CoA desaturase (delta-9 desaturase)